MHGLGNWVVRVCLVRLSIIRAEVRVATVARTVFTHYSSPPLCVRVFKFKANDFGRQSVSPTIYMTINELF